MKLCPRTSAPLETQIIPSKKPIGIEYQMEGKPEYKILTNTHIVL